MDAELGSVLMSCAFRRVLTGFSLMVVLLLDSDSVNLRSRGVPAMVGVWGEWTTVVVSVLVMVSSEQPSPSVWLYGNTGGVC